MLLVGDLHLAIHFCHSIRFAHRRQEEGSEHVLLQDMFSPLQLHLCDDHVSGGAQDCTAEHDPAQGTGAEQKLK